MTSSLRLLPLLCALTLTVTVFVNQANAATGECKTGGCQMSSSLPVTLVLESISRVERIFPFVGLVSAVVFAQLLQHRRAAQVAPVSRFDR